MSETTAGPSAPADAAAAAQSPASATAEAVQQRELSIRSLLEAGVHFGHQTRRWNPHMRPYIFGDRNGTHILDLDQTLPCFREGLDFIRETVSEGGQVLFVGTKRQAAPSIQTQALRAGQYYANNRWLGGMLTNWKTVKKSIDRYKSMLALLADEEQRNTRSKKELAQIHRQCEKYAKSLEGIKDMSGLPSVMFVIDVGKEAIAVSEARRLGIPIVAIVDSNCNPEGIDFVVPGNDDAIRSVELYCHHVAEMCIEGAALYNERIQSEPTAADGDERAPASGRRVVEIRQAPRRGRGQAGGRPGGGRPGGGGRDSDWSGAGGTHSAGGWARSEPVEEPTAAEATPSTPTPAAPEPAPTAPTADPEGVAAPEAPAGAVESEAKNS